MSVKSTGDILLTETHQERLLRVGKAHPRFLQGVFPFVGRGLFEIGPLDDTLSYTVPTGTHTQVVYFRAGNASEALVYVALAANGVPVRYFPIGPNADVHVALAIIESYSSGTILSVVFAAPRGTNGTLIVDIGLIECEAGA